MVGERGFEPPAPASRRQCSTRLSYSPTGASGRSQPGDRWRVYRERRWRAQAGLCRPSRAQQVGDGGEFFAGAALSRPGDFGRLDLLPVAEGDDVDAAAFEKRVEPGPPFFADRKSKRLNSSHYCATRRPSSPGKNK